jgi:hypothetical protein
MLSVIRVTDPILRVRTVTGTARVGLHELLHLSHTEGLIDLLGVRADQRAPVVTALAIITHLVMRYSPSVPATADDWRDALAAQFGDCLTLVSGSDDKPQFFQPIIDMTLAQPLTITEMDHLMPAMRHQLKAVAEASPEEVLYALMSSTWRHHGGVGHHAGARARLLTVLVGDGLTIGSEIVSLGAAYTAMRPHIVGSDASAARLLDHMLWAQPWIDAQPLTKVPYPFIDCRRIRLAAAHAGLVGAVFVSSTASRVDTATGNIEEPHTPILTRGSIYKLVMKRNWSHRVQHAAVAGSDEVTRPRILDLAPPYSAVRISGVHQDQGKTLGYWEATYRIGSSRRIRLAPPAPGDRLSTLSAMALTTVSIAERILYGPVLTLFDGKLKTAKPYLNRLQADLRNRIGPASLRIVLSLLDKPPDTQREQATLNAMAAAGVRAVWSVAANSSCDALHTARASDQLDGILYAKLGEHLMSDDTAIPLSQRVHATLHEMNGHLTPDNRARLRSAGTALPLDAYVALAAVPASETDSPATMSVWQTTVRALGVIRHGGHPIGAVLAATGYPETRINALLTAQGETLIGLIAEVVRWLVAHDVMRASLTDLVTLGLTDALGDAPAHQQIVQRIALTFTRAQRRATRAA